MALDLKEMNREARDFCLKCKAKFPELDDNAIGRIAKFAVLGKYALREAEAGLPDGMTLSPAGVEMVLTECGKWLFAERKPLVEPTAESKAFEAMFENEKGE